MPRFELWRRVLLALSALFAVQAAGWAILGSFDPFGFYEGHMARAMWGADALPADARRAFAFVLMPFGATTAGFFVLVFLVVRHAFPRREPWAWRAVATGIGTWFALDTALCATHGAWFNVLIVNLPCIALLGPTLLALRPGFDTPSGHPDV